MGQVNYVADLQQDGDVAIIGMDNAPVNTLGHALRSRLMLPLERPKSTDAKVVLLTGTARAFSGGSDIAEFGKPRLPLRLLDVIDPIEAFDRPVVAAISGARALWEDPAVLAKRVKDSSGALE